MLLESDEAYIKYILWALKTFHEPKPKKVQMIVPLSNTFYRQLNITYDKKKHNPIDVASYVRSWVNKWN
jgi:hypothetical protein